ncbi:hypothetical protein JWG44_11345 [Leptospira sp. 201903071]|uniref:hypothetical protein n=1 Tax=Leptospira ainazelensis TaxID=2810034 RepID=UPI0019638F36|nr:hypothetical protein [Leptospira ainazelensis]MBM9500843.1 hypothetical protein [Leptospira ainazelensis]
MLSFSKLIEEYKEELDPIRKRGLLISYFCFCDTKEIDPAFQFLSGRKEKAISNENDLILFVSEYLDQPLWMIRSAIEEVGNVAEAISLLTGNPSSHSKIGIDVILENANQIINSNDQGRKILFSIWEIFPVPEKTFFHKLLLGKQNLKIQDTILTEILAGLFDLEVGVLLNKFQKSKINFKTISILEILSSWFPDRELKRLDEVAISERIDPSLPKRWLLPSPFLEDQISVGTHFLICHDGIPAEAVLHSSEVFIWTKSGFLFKNEAPSIFLEFSKIKKNARILGWISGNKNNNIDFVYYDILEYEGQNTSLNSIKERKRILDSFFTPEFGSIREAKWNIVSEKIDSGEFQRKFLKGSRNAFLFDPDENEFLEFKTPLRTIKAVLLYGRKSMNNEGSAFWELSFGVPSKIEENEFHTIARIAIQSNHSLFLEIDSFFKENTIEKKGPIRGVPTIWKAELSFQNILASKRHKMGFVLEDVKILGKISSEESIDTLYLLLGSTFDEK